MNLERTKNIAEIISAWVSSLALAVGGCFAAYQYLENKKGERIKEALEFYKNFNNGHFYEARKNIDLVWDKYSSQQNEILERKPFDPKEHDNFVLSTIENENLAQEVQLLISFFESIEICIKNNICDEKVSLAFLRPDACAFYHQNFARISLERSKTNDSSIGIELRNLCRRK